MLSPLLPQGITNPNPSVYTRPLLCSVRLYSTQPPSHTVPFVNLCPFIPAIVQIGKSFFKLTQNTLLAYYYQDRLETLL